MLSVIVVVVVEGEFRMWWRWSLHLTYSGMRTIKLDFDEVLDVVFTAKAPLLMPEMDCKCIQLSHSNVELSGLRMIMLY